VFKEEILHLSKLLEEARRVEELISNQLKERENQCEILEVEIVSMRNKS